MEIYKGASAFAGIAIGKIRFYRKGEYQIRQHQADDVKKELKNFDVARRHVMQTLKEEYDRMSEKQMDTADPELDMEPQPLDRIVKVNGENGTNQILEQAELLGSGSFLREVQSMITGEKVTAAYAVQTTRDEIADSISRQKMYLERRLILLQRMRTEKRQSTRLVFQRANALRQKPAFIRKRQWRIIVPMAFIL